MCGIFGLWDKTGQPVLCGVLNHAASLLQHRGPDAAGVYLDGSLGLAHTRLKILDLSDAANQPFTDTGHALVYNGEIFNADELRRMLSPYHAFRTKSDTEVLFVSLCHYGPEVTLRRLDGQFAFAFYDRTQQSLTLARDHAGICPLYLHETADHLAFCSEIRPLLETFGPSELDVQGVMDYFAYRYNIQNGRTLFATVRRFPAASLLTVEMKSRQISRPRRYWRMPFCSRSEDAVEVLHALDDSLRRQLSADVPVGLFLSGGIDSRVVLHGALHHTSRPLTAFTLRMNGAKDSDARQAQALRQIYNFNWHCIDWAQDTLLQGLPNTVLALEEPFGDVIICANEALANVASHSVRVVLSGEGGDEAFWGYDHQRALMTLRYVATIPLAANLAAFCLYLAPSTLLNILSGYAGKYGAGEKHHICRCLRAQTDAQAYLNLVRIFQTNELRALFNPHFLHNAPADADTRPILDIFHEETDIVRASMRVELEQCTLPLNLMKQDRLCMAHSLESRVPLVARPVLERVATLPTQQLCTKPPKAILQEYANLRGQRKNAFSVLNSSAYDRQCLALWDSHVTESIGGGLFRPSALAALRQTIPSGGVLDIKRAMAVTVFFAWLKKFNKYIVY